MRNIRKRAWLLAALSGVLQVLIFPLPNLYFLGWVAVAPLLVAVLANQRPGPQLIVNGREVGRTTPGQGFLLGYLSGIIWYAGTCYWVYYTMKVYGGLASPIAAGLLVLFCLYLALYHGLFGLLLVLAGRGREAPSSRVLALAPFLWVAVELARARISGFPWDLLGTTQVDNIPLARLATFTGVYGISFGIVVVNAAFAATFLLPRHRRQVMLLTAAAAAFLLQLGIVVKPGPQPTTHSARLVQANVPILGGGAWTTEFFRNTLDELAAMSLQGELKTAPPRLVVWPESPTPFYLKDPVFHHRVASIAREGNVYLMAGSLGVRDDPTRDHPPELTNTAALMGPSGQWAARYDKVHLVPFGEYVPFRSILVFANKLTREVGDFYPGADRSVFILDGYTLGAFICYESIFPDEVRIFAQRGAQVFVNISNDGWFGPTGAPIQHLNMARMRAIENHRWILRGTNTGVTASIDPYGRVVARAERNRRTALEAPYAFVAGTTFYTRHGDAFAYLCAIISIAAIVVRFRFRAGVLRSH